MHDQAELQGLLSLQDQAKLRFMSSIVHFSCHHRTRAIIPPTSFSHILLLYTAPQHKHALPLLSRAQLLQLLCLCSHVRHMQDVLLRGKLQTRMLKSRSVLATRICSEAVVRWLLRQGGGGGGGGGRGGGGEAPRDAAPLRDAHDDGYQRRVLTRLPHMAAPGACPIPLKAQPAFSCRFPYSTTATGPHNLLQQSKSLQRLSVKASSTRTPAPASLNLYHSKPMTA
jgi:hypothetical protein